jgi:outer membrane protein assembly factor BamD (BamD/ComL family)
VGSLARERELLDVARAALVHGDFEDALGAVRKHETQWPHGALEEEREALAIQALAAAGRTPAADARAARFRRAFPASMLADVVNAALTRGPAAPAKP